MINTYSMKQLDLYDVTSLVKFCTENTSRRQVFSVNFDQACDAIFMASKIV